MEQLSRGPHPLAFPMDLSGHDPSHAATTTSYPYRARHHADEVAFGAQRYGCQMVVSWRSPVRLGSADPRLVIGEGPKAEGQWTGRRLLIVDGSPAFEISYWCGTCQFLFERLEGSNQTLSLDELQKTLNQGVTELEPAVLEAFGSLLEKGRYLPLLFNIRPRLVRPADEADYFSTEQVATWGREPFWDLPVHPRTPYYRSFSTSVSDDAHLYEFIVPMVPPSWNDRDQVGHYTDVLQQSSLPTAVAVSTLDICAPAVERGPDYYAHWGLTHFLLDGHHKVEAAARGGHRLQLLALLAVDASLADEAQVLQVPELRDRRDHHRQARTTRSRRRFDRRSIGDT